MRKVMFVAFMFVSCVGLAANAKPTGVKSTFDKARAARCLEAVKPEQAAFELCLWPWDSKTLEARARECATAFIVEGWFKHCPMDSDESIETCKQRRIDKQKACSAVGKDYNCDELPPGAWLSCTELVDQRYRACINEALYSEYPCKRAIQDKCEAPYKASYLECRQGDDAITKACQAQSNAIGAKYDRCYSKGKR